LRPRRTERAGLGIGQPGFDNVAGALQALQGSHGVISAQAAGEGVGQTSRKKVDFAGVAVGGPGRDDLDANRQGSGLQHGDQLAQRAAFPFGRSVSGWSDHACVSLSS
jgi:hypothetical protein